MEFPKWLNWGDRKVFPKNKILLVHYMYARHKPGSDWKENDEYPDFSKIRSTQSFNWSAFSIPIWTRFNDKKEYYQDYGVIGYAVQTIRYPNQFDSKVPNGIFDIKHDPADSNYSHCELYESSDSSTKIEKRAYRMALVHKCSIELKPLSTKSNLQLFLDYVIMYWHRSLIWIKSDPA